MARNDLSAKAQEQLGLPQGFKIYSPMPFGGMNWQASPIAIPDSDFVYVENFVRLGDGNMRTLWDVGTPIFTASTGLTVVYHVFFTIASTYYCAVFLSDGSAVQVNMADLSQTPLGPPTTFYNAATGYLPYGKQWGSTYLLISNRNTVNDYWAWDGVQLYAAGGAAPNGVVLASGGLNYTATPSVVPYGGSGNGMVLVPEIRAGSVVGFIITNPGYGYKPGDVVQLQFSGGGSDTAAILTPVLTPTTVGAVSVLAGGSGYTSPPTVTIDPGTGTSGSSGYWTFVWNGSQWIPVYIPGTPGTGGSGATATATIQNGSVVAIVVTSVGSGYTATPAINITGGGGIGAVAQVLLSPTTVASVTVTNGGTNYGGVSGTTPPLLSFSGGGGSGATATAVLAVGSHVPIASVTMGALGSGYTGTPAVIIAPGNNNAAYASVTLMPYGISGSAMETYLSRVWIVNPATQQFSTIPPGNSYTVTAPGSITNTAVSAGGVSGQNTDSFLQKQYVNVRQSSGYLYFFGDGSVSVVSNVSTGGSPLATTYSYYNVDPQTGLSWRDSIQDFGKTIVISNELGAFGLFGGSLTKISDDLDDFIFKNVVFPPSGGVVPSSAIATIYNVKHYLNLVTIRDPDTNSTRNVMLGWNGKKWVVASQSLNLTAISTQKISSLYQAYGTDGSGIYPLFVRPSSTLVKRLDLKQYGADEAFIQKQALATWVQASDNSITASGISGTLTAYVSGIATLNGTPPATLTSGLYNTYTLQPNFVSQFPSFGLWGTSMEGLGFVTMSVRFTTTSPDFTLGNFVIGYKHGHGYYGQ